MKINLKAGGERYTVEFTVIPSTDKMSESDFIAIPKSSKDSDKLQTAIVNRGGNDQAIGALIAKAIENKLKLPMEPDYGHTQGNGYGVKIDKYSIVKKLK